ncbi:MAG: hypothetical protein RLP14_00820 [Owenweeksia sp.]
MKKVVYTKDWLFVVVCGGLYSPGYGSYLFMCHAISFGIEF